MIATGRGDVVCSPVDALEFGSEVSRVCCLPGCCWFPWSGLEPTLFRGEEPYTRSMGLEANEVYKAGLALDQDERALVAYRLLESIRQEDSTVVSETDSAWVEEISARVDDVLAGQVELTTFAQSRAKAQSLLKTMRR